MPDGADVLGHVFAHLAVAPGGRVHQHAVLVAQVHGQAVKLGLCHVFHGGVGIGQAQFTANAGVKRVCAAGFCVGFGANAEHGHRMAHGGKGVQRLTTHAAGWGIGPGQMGVFRLQRLQAAKQAVVLGIGHLRGIQHVVTVGVMVQDA